MHTSYSFPGHIFRNIFLCKNSITTFIVALSQPHESSFEQTYINIPLKQCLAIHLNKLEYPLHNNVICQVWLIVARLFWRGRWKWENFTTTTVGKTDSGHILIGNSNLSRRLRRAKIGILYLSSLINLNFYFKSF